MKRLLGTRMLGGPRTAGGGSVPPVGASLSVVDQEDGTGATATIAGAAGYTNDVLVYSLAGVLVNTFTRSGNGTIDLTLAVGQYVAILTCDDFVADAPEFFSVTDGGITSIDHAVLLEVLLSYSTTWQQLAGVANAGAALAYSHRYEIPESSNYPRALIQDDPLWSGPLGIGVSNGGGTLILSFLISVNIGTYTTREARRDYVRQKVYQIRKEMLETSNSRATPAGYSVSHLVVRKMTMLAPPFELRADQVPAKAGHLPVPTVWGVEFSVEW